MLEQKYAVPDLKINQIIDGRMPGSVFTSLNSVANLLIFFQPSQFGTQNRTFFYPGWALLLVPFLGLFLWRTKGKNCRTANVICLSGILILLACTELFPWHMFQTFLYQIQFTWRLIQSAVTLLSLAGGIYIGIFVAEKNKIIFFFIHLIICLIPAVPMFISIDKTHMRNINDFYMLNNQIGEGEYLPPQLTRNFFDENSDKVVDKNNHTEFSNFNRNGLSLEFDFSQHQGDIEFIVPLIYYKGYDAEIKSNSGTAEKVFVNAAENGLVRICGNAYDKGSVHVWYKGTNIQMISNWISVLTIAGWAAMEIRKRILKTG